MLNSSTLRSETLLCFRALLVRKYERISDAWHFIFSFLLSFPFLLFILCFHWNVFSSECGLPLEWSIAAGLYSHNHCIFYLLQFFIFSDWWFSRFFVMLSPFISFHLVLPSALLFSESLLSICSAFLWILTLAYSCCFSSLQFQKKNPNKSPLRVDDYLH